MKIIPDPESWGAISSNAERRVAELITQVDLGAQATCLYSLHLPRHAYKRMSEIDFLIITPQALLVIEVKGGRLGRHDGVWTFTDRHGHVNQKREGPFEQARSAMFALEVLLAERHPRLRTATGYLVITPDQELGDDIEWDKVHHVGAARMSVAGLELALRASLSHWAGTKKTRGSDYGELVRALRPDFDLVPSLASRAARLRSEYVTLAERQYELIIAAERNPRLLCLGGAGSGKTLLAVETATRAAVSGKDVLLTCRSPGLARYLSAALAGTTVRVLTFGQDNRADPADVLVIDEAQDLMDVESYVGLDALVKGGIEDGCWRIFCDPNNQANVHGQLDPAILADIQRRSMIVELPYNCRNTIPVVHQTQMVTGADLGVARAGEGPHVDYAQAATGADTAALLDAHLKRLRRQEVVLDTVCIVTLCDEVSESAALRSRAFRQGQIVRYDGDPLKITAGSARLMTAAEIKGLEAEHVCVLDVDDVLANDARAKLYVAMTRPTISLWVALGVSAWCQLSGLPDKDEQTS